MRIGPSAAASIALGAVLLAATAAAEEAPAAPPAPPTPCAEHDRFADFDFWLGHWEVKTADGTVAGKNEISRAENGCVILEAWQGSQGGSGISMNYFDVATSEWVQVWTGGGGSQIQIRGGIRDGSMVLVGKLHYVGQSVAADFRGTWTPLTDGRVRQFFEQSSDGGKTWSPWFEGFYSRQAVRLN